ncbi:MAG: hypothetical protein D3917_08320 [Candidatus Electrothrix sp. AX5]|nr:hypothetical protein [Candidatus Electrothrix sp. AX5]
MEINGRLSFVSVLSVFDICMVYTVCIYSTVLLLVIFKLSCSEYQTDEYKQRENIDKIPV